LERNNGSETHPYFMTKSLLKIMNLRNEPSTKTQQNDIPIPEYTVTYTSLEEE